MAAFTFTTSVRRDLLVGRGLAVHPDDASILDGKLVREAALARAEERATDMGWTVHSIESFTEFVPSDLCAARVVLNVSDDR